MDLEALKQLPPWARELGSALLVVSAVFMLTWAYTGNWPPMVVIESGSMRSRGRGIRGRASASAGWCGPPWYSGLR